MILQADVTKELKKYIYATLYTVYVVYGYGIYEYSMRRRIQYIRVYTKPSKMPLTFKKNKNKCNKLSHGPKAGVNIKSAIGKSY